MFSRDRGLQLQSVVSEGRGWVLGGSQHCVNKDEVTMFQMRNFAGSGLLCRLQLPPTEGKDVSPFLEIQMNVPRHVECAVFCMFSCSYMIIVQLRRVNHSCRPRTHSRALAALNPTSSHWCCASLLKPQTSRRHCKYRLWYIGSNLGLVYKQTSCGKGDIWFKPGFVQ